MGMTPAELELLGGMRAWADRNTDAIGTALAEHTFGAGASGAFLRAYAAGRASASPTSSAAGAAPRPGTCSEIFVEAAKPNGFGIACFEGLLGVGALHSKINLPLKWFLGTYPVLLDIVHDAMRADVPEPARVAKRSWRAEVRDGRRRAAARRRARAVADLQLRLAGDRRGVLLRHVRVDRR